MTSLRLWRCRFDQAFNNSFHQRLASIQYNAALAITGAGKERKVPFQGKFPKKNSISKLVSSPCYPEDGFENYLACAK